MDLFMPLPGEVLLHILKFVLVPEVPDKESLSSYVSRATPFRLVSLRFNAAVEAIAGIHAHTFPGPLQSPLHIESISCHPTPHVSLNAHRKYWSYFLPRQRDRQCTQFALDTLRYLTIPRLPNLRTISIDFVITNQKRKRDCTDSALYDEGVVVAALERISSTSHSIEQAYLRIPPSQRCIDLVQSIVAKNAALQSLCVEVDSAVSNSSFRPKFLLNHLTLPHMRYAPLRRFVVRAPSCDVHFIVAPHRQRPFFRRLAEVTEFGLVSYNFATTLPNWYWVYILLRSTPALVLCDIAITMPDDHHLPQASTPVRPFQMAHLQQLSLHIPEIDTHMLSSMDAPYLYILRLRSTVHIELWPNCGEDHFPSLFIVNIICPGPSGLRLDVLGIEYENYYHNLGTGHDYYQASRNDFLAYIKPYDRVRPKPPTAPYPGEYFRRLPIPTILPPIPPSSPSSGSSAVAPPSSSSSLLVSVFPPSSTPSSPLATRPRLTSV
ncbi:hypothetical protein OC844_005493 [Tilletia horrida]|nr:hypothetical protein OC844_005493 [Tilletia horrida]